MTTDEKLDQLIDFFINMYANHYRLMTREELEIALKKIKEGEEIKKEKEFDPTKPVQTRNGRKARILCTDRKNTYPIVALITFEDEEFYHAYTKEGKYWEDEDYHEYDLINI